MCSDNKLDKFVEACKCLESQERDGGILWGFTESLDKTICSNDLIQAMQIQQECSWFHISSLGSLPGNVSHLQSTPVSSIYLPEGSFLLQTLIMSPSPHFLPYSHWRCFKLPRGTCIHSAGVLEGFTDLNGQQQSSQPVKQVALKEGGSRRTEWPINHSLSPCTVNEVMTLK